ncbi:MAG: sulfurtransferase TusA family protein [Anaerolineae bacterium]|nr:sulfurtransferase TusA family protein [Anaerolineae bacterium]MCB9142441.1 sulfurtransferase TusA family protein [Anaerolineales bacterium]
MLRRLQSGQSLEVRATDLGVAVDLPAWCRMTGHTLVDQRADRYLIRHK